VNTEQAERVAAAARKAALDRADPMRGMAFELLAHLHRREGAAFAPVLGDVAEPIEIRMRAAEILDPTTVMGEGALGAVASDEGAPLPLRVQAVRSLAAGCLTAAPALARARASSEPMVRDAAAAGLAGLGQADALKAALAPDGDPERRAAAAALGALGHKPIWALPLLEASLADPVLRPVAFRAIADIGVPAVPVLVSALRSPQADVRLGAAQALQVVRWTAKAAVGPLEEAAAHDADERVRAAAASALREIGPSFAQLAVELERARDENARVLAISATRLPLLLRAPADPVVVAPLRRLMHDPSARVRSEAISTLGQAGAPALVAVPEILSLLASDPELGVRAVAALALAPLHQAAVAPDTRAAIAAALERARQDKAAFVRQCADQSAGAVRAGLQRPYERCVAAR
jgi:HEAT repeat protein